MSNRVNPIRTLLGIMLYILFNYSLCQIIAILPATSVDCERGFSCLNQIKTDLRNRLKTEHLGSLIRLSTMDMDAMSLQRDHSERLILAWRRSKARRSSDKGDRILDAENGPLGDQ